MTKNTTRNQRKILDGKVELYQRNDAATGKESSNNWYAKFRLPGVKGRSVRRTLGTQSKAEAEILAQDLYFDLSQKSKKGLSLNPKRFELLANSYLKDVEIKQRMSFH